MRGTLGTIGFLAPEIEHDVVAKSYGVKVDIWSLGVVAYRLFVSSRIPWSTAYNMFVPVCNQLDPTLHIFREVRGGLLQRPLSSIERLIGLMLDENPRSRLGVHGVLAHPALAHVRAIIDGKIENDKATGQKRRQDALAVISPGSMSRKTG